MEVWTKILNFKKDPPSNLSKLRVDLRFYAELISVGVFTLKEGLPLLGSSLTNIINSDKENHANINIILTFCKFCGDEYAGLLPRKIRTLANNYNYQVPSDSLIPSEKQKNVRTILINYYNSVRKKLIRDFTDYHNLERMNKRILLSKGEVHAERLEKAESAGTALAKLTLNVDQLADVLDEDVPLLEKPGNEDKKDEDDEDDEENCTVSLDICLAGGLWEDEDAKNFYEDLADLKAKIPAILYKDSSNVVVEREEDVIGEDDNEEIIEEDEEDLQGSAPSESVEQEEMEDELQ